MRIHLQKITRCYYRYLIIQRRWLMLGKSKCLQLIGPDTLSYFVLSNIVWQYINKHDRFWELMGILTEQKLVPRQETHHLSSLFKKSMSF